MLAHLLCIYLSSCELGLKYESRIWGSTTTYVAQGSHIASNSRWKVATICIHTTFRQGLCWPASSTGSSGIFIALRPVSSWHLFWLRGSTSWRAWTTSRPPAWWSALASSVWSGPRRFSTFSPGRLGSALRWWIWRTGGGQVFRFPLAPQVKVLILPELVIQTLYSRM